MSDFLNRVLPRLIALGLVALMAKAVSPDETHWWLIFCFVGIMWVLEFLAFRHGVVMGLMMYKSATPDQRRDLDRIMESDQ